MKQIFSAPISHACSMIFAIGGPTMAEGW